MLVTYRISACFPPGGIFTPDDTTICLAGALSGWKAGAPISCCVFLHLFEPAQFTDPRLCHLVTASYHHWRYVAWRSDSWQFHHLPVYLAQTRGGGHPGKTFRVFDAGRYQTFPVQFTPGEAIPR